MKIGVVPYINALPLCFHLPYPVSYGTPVELASLMERGELDVALIPSFAFLENPTYIPHYEAGIIQSQGPVKSVMLYYRQECKKPQNITSIKYSSQSVTSVNLFRVLYSLYWGLDLKKLVQNSSDPDAELLIGDEALFFSKKGFKNCDLGRLWDQWTGLPFVYALWVSRQALPQSVIDQFVAAKNKGLENIEAIIKKNQDLPGRILKSYLTKNIQYNFSPASLDGLEMFRNSCYQLRLLESKRDVQAA